MLRREIDNIILEILSDKLVIIAYLGFLIVLFLLRTIVFTPKRKQKSLSRSSKSEITSVSNLDEKEKTNSEKKQVTNESDQNDQTRISSVKKS